MAISRSHTFPLVSSAKSTLHFPCPIAIAAYFQAAYGHIGTEPSLLNSWGLSIIHMPFQGLFRPVRMVALMASLASEARHSFPIGRPLNAVRPAISIIGRTMITLDFTFEWYDFN